MATLELQGLQKRFGDVVALRQLDLEIASGEFVAFLGPSGCGKTTALRIVAGFEQSDHGRVLVDGKDVTATPANRRDMGMVFQAYSLFPNLTAQENVAFGLRVRHISAAQRRVRAQEMLDLVGLASTVNRYPHQLSGGQQQRVALARALAIQPRVLLLDEPLSALDAQVRVQLRDEIRRIQTHLGITTLFVTHDQEEALSISDRVVVLSQGQIEQVGTPAEIYGSPSSLFVAQFIGTMNHIAGVISAAPSGHVDSHGTLLRVDRAREWTPGSAVHVLIRPESIQVAPLDNGAAGPDGLLDGYVRIRTFQGPMTRLTVESRVGDIKVDLGSAQALALSEGTHISLSWDPSSPQLISSDQAPSTSLPAAPPPLSRQPQAVT